MRRLLNRLEAKYSAVGVKSVGYGVAQKKDRFDRKRGPAVVFFVHRKWQSDRPNSAKKLPKTVSTFVTRKGKKLKVILPTDVVEQHGTIRPSGYKTERFTSSKFVTTGVSVTWNTPSGIEQWGIVTVAHFVPDPLGSALGDSLVMLLPTPGTSVTGEILIRMPRSEKVDAVLIRVDKAELNALGLTTPDGTVVRRFFDIADDGGKSALSYPYDAASTSIKFTAGHYRPELNVGTFKVRDVVKAEGLKGDFAEGRSGCIWLRLGELVGLQVARVGPDDDEGYAQVFVTTWDELNRKAEADGIVKSGSLKLICTF